MSKYIRTKEDKIIKIDENGCVKEFNVFGKKTLFAFKDKNYSYRFENGKEIIKQSENLEELCDEFVVVWLPTNHKDIFCIDDYSKKVIESCIGNNKTNVYGAIWTDRGLIYVAKMNESGDLELI